MIYGSEAASRRFVQAVSPQIKESQPTMDAAEPRPSGCVISAETTEPHISPLSGKASELILHLTVTETHKWFGIGGRSARLRRPRRLGRIAHMLSARPFPVLSGDDLRRLMVRQTARALCRYEVFRRLSDADWEDAVPLGAEALVAESAAAAVPDGGCGCRCDVYFCIHVDFEYDEAEELLRSCVAAGNLPGTGSGGDAPPSCAICFEEMAPDAEETAWLPGCAHGFHSVCIGRWFEKASTCPLCRRDKLRHLPPAYKAVRGRILSDPEGSC